MSAKKVAVVGGVLVWPVVCFGPRGRPQNGFRKFARLYFGNIIRIFHCFNSGFRPENKVVFATQIGHPDPLGREGGVLLFPENWKRNVLLVVETTIFVSEVHCNTTKRNNASREAKLSQQRYLYCVVDKNNNNTK